MINIGFKALKEQKVLDALVVVMTRRIIRKNDSTNRVSHFVDLNNFVLGLGSIVPLNIPANRAV